MPLVKRKREDMSKIFTGKEVDFLTVVATATIATATKAYSNQCPLTVW